MLGLFSAYFGSKINAFEINQEFFENAKTDHTEFNELLAEKSINKLSTDYKLRSIEIDDYKKGYVELLSQLTETGKITQEMFQQQFSILYHTNTTFIAVIEHNSTQKIISSATLVLERKFIYECGTRGRIEDVVIDKEYRGKSFGKLLNQCLVEIARDYFKVYKLSLECKDELISFYEQFGYKKDSNNNFLMQRFSN